MTKGAKVSEHGWNRDRINRRTANHVMGELLANGGVTEVISRSDVREMMVEMLGDMQARIQQLEAALAESRRPAAEAQGEWQPMPQGNYEDVYVGSRTLSLRLPKEIVGSQVSVFLPDDIRLCRRVAATSEATVGSVFSSVASSVASSLAITMLQQTLDEGKSISIPSLGIVIEPNKVDTSEATGGDTDEA